MLEPVKFQLIMEEKIRKIVSELQELIMEKMPETGDFEPIVVRCDCNDKKWKTKKVWLSAESPPEGVEGREVKRGIILFSTDEMTAFEIMVSVGTKQELLKIINAEGYVDRLVDYTEELDMYLRSPD